MGSSPIWTTDCQQWLEGGGNWTYMDSKRDPEDPKVIKATTTQAKKPKIRSTP